MLNCLVRTKKIDDINTVLDLERALHQVGPGTGREADFANAITMEDMEGSYILSYDTDGSMSPETAFNLAMEELSDRFTNLNGEIKTALK